MDRRDEEVGESKQEREQESFGDPLSNRLMMGDWGAVGEMSEDVDKDSELVQEVMEILRALRERTLMERTDEERKQDT